MPLSDRDCSELRDILQTKRVGYGYDDMARYLKRADWVVSKRAGSHRTWRQKGKRRIVLPERTPLLPVYVREVATRLVEEECR